jgi:predicted enzyme related to lactoylglutathione lyase
MVQDYCLILERPNPGPGRYFPVVNQLLQTRRTIMADVFKQHGAFSWSELQTTDVEGAKKFYSELLGWTTEDFPSEEIVYTVVKAEGAPVGGIMAMPPQAAGAPPHWGVYITVKDVDAAAQKAVKLGATVIVPPMDISKVGRFTLIKDPQGAMFYMITYVQM